MVQAALVVDMGLQAVQEGLLLTRQIAQIEVAAVAVQVALLLSVIQTLLI
jgi:hypothetical protein